MVLVDKSVTRCRSLFGLRAMDQVEHIDLMYLHATSPSNEWSHCACSLLMYVTIVILLLSSELGTDH